MPLSYKIELLTDILDVGVREFSESIAIECDGRSISYAELAHRSSVLASGLRELGVLAGEKVAWLGRASEGWFEIAFGAALARVVLTPINSRLAVPEIAFILEDCEAKVLFVSPEFFDTAREALENISRNIELIKILPDKPAASSFAVQPTVDVGIMDRPLPDDDLLMLYTSGTTGKPKGVRLTHRNYAAFLDLRANIRGFLYESGESVLVFVPLFHVAGTNMGFASLASGARIVLRAEFTPAGAVRLIREEQISHVFLAPVMIKAILNLPGITSADLASLKTVSYGSSAISVDTLVKAADLFGCDFIQFYGLTESLGAGTMLSAEQHIGEQLKSSGKCWPGLEVRIASPSGESLPPGLTGEVEIRGGVVMAGYWKCPEATEQAIRADGWLRTGDAGCMDENGFVYIRDRMKDMIVSGGENVYATEVEDVICTCPGILEVAVIGIPDEKWGEAVMAVVVLSGERVVTPEDIANWARGKIAGYKIPKRIEFIDALPRNSSGKVLRRELRVPYWQDRDRNVS